MSDSNIGNTSENKGNHESTISQRLLDTVGAVINGTHNRTFISNQTSTQPTNSSIKQNSFSLQNIGNTCNSVNSNVNNQNTSNFSNLLSQLTKTESKPVFEQPQVSTFDNSETIAKIMEILNNNGQSSSLQNINSGGFNNVPNTTSSRQAMNAQHSISEPQKGQNMNGQIANGQIINSQIMMAGLNIPTSMMQFTPQNLQQMYSEQMVAKLLGVLNTNNPNSIRTQHSISSQENTQFVEENVLNSKSLRNYRI